MGILAECLGLWPFVEGGDKAWWPVMTFQNPQLLRMSSESSADLFFSGQKEEILEENVRE